MGLKPNETIIFEDSSHGVMAAQDSGCHLFTVKNLSDISYSNISNFINYNIELLAKENMENYNKLFDLYKSLGFVKTGNESVYSDNYGC